METWEKIKKHIEKPCEGRWLALKCLAWPGGSSWRHAPTICSASGTVYTSEVNFQLQNGRFWGHYKIYKPVFRLYFLGVLKTIEQFFFQDGFMMYSINQYNVYSYNQFYKWSSPIHDPSILGFPRDYGNSQMAIIRGSTDKPTVRCGKSMKINHFWVILGKPLVFQIPTRGLTGCVWTPNSAADVTCCESVWKSTFFDR